MLCGRGTPHPTVCTAFGRAYGRFATVHPPTRNSWIRHCWQDATTKALPLQLAEPILPRQRKPPKRIDAGSDGVVFQTPKDLYRSIYSQFLDHNVEHLKYIFDI